MNPSLKTWSIALPVSLAVHFALVVGFKPLTEGFQEPPAGASISVEASLAGIMGQMTPNAEEVAEQETSEVESTEQTETVDPAETESVAAKTEHRKSEPGKPNTVDPTDEMASVKADTAQAQTISEAPVAAVQSEDAAPMREVDAAREVETAAVPSEAVTSPTVSETEPVEVAPKPVEAVKPRATKSKKKKTKKRAARTPPGNNRKGSAGKRQGSKKGRARASSGAILSYAARVRARIAGNRPGAVGTGRVVVSFGLSSSGGLRYARIARSSGVASIDRAALSAVRRSSPFPRPPAGASSTQLRFSIPFHFQ